jgi:hypothetical protein
MFTIPKRKADIDWRYDSRDHNLPALNVKHYGAVEYTPAKIAAEFDCDETTAERVAGWCYESAQEDFWERALDCINFAMLGEAGDQYKPTGLKDGPYEIFADGRSGGWLVVRGLGSIADMSGATFQKWRKFARLIKCEMEHLASWEWAKDMIECNEWAPKRGTVEAAAEAVRCGDNAPLAKVARDIHKVMNGAEWSADTHEAVADCFTRHGFRVANYEEE